MFLVPPEKKAIHDSRGVLEIWPGRTSILILFKSLWSCSWWFDMWREASNPLINTIRLFLSFDYPHQPLFNSSQGFHNASGMMCDLLIQSRVMLLGVITAATPWPWAGGQVVPINQSSITSSLSSRDNSGRSRGRTWCCLMANVSLWSSIEHCSKKGLHFGWKTSIEILDRMTKPSMV